MTLHFNYHPRRHSDNNKSFRSSVLVVTRWLWPGNKTFSEVGSMVVTWWIVAFLCSASYHHVGLLCQQILAANTQIFMFTQYYIPSGVIKLSMFTHTHPHKLLRKIMWPPLQSLCRLTTHFTCGLMSDLVICKHGQRVWSHKTPNVLTETNCQ